MMPPDFRFTAFGPAELWTALRLDPPRARPPYFLRVIGRLKPGVNAQQAHAEVNAIANQMQQQYPNSTPKVVRVEQFKRAIVGDAQLSLSVLLGAVFFVLLIASVNVANLLLARATGAGTRDSRPRGARRQPFAPDPAGADRVRACWH